MIVLTWRISHWASALVRLHLQFTFVEFLDNKGVFTMAGCAGEWTETSLALGFCINR